MKKITMFHLIDCKYCDFARKAIKELREENPEYEKVEIEMVDECWTIAATESDARKAAANIRGALSRGIEGHSMEEWRKLFVNAYGSEVD